MEKRKFKCNCCNNIFEGEAHEKEFIDYTYGPCKTNYSYCPCCGNEASEYKKPSQKNVKENINSCCCNCSCCS